MREVVAPVQRSSIPDQTRQHPGRGVQLLRGMPRHSGEAPQHPTPKFGSWTATGIAGNAVLGSVYVTSLGYDLQIVTIMLAAQLLRFSSGRPGCRCLFADIVARSLHGHLPIPTVRLSAVCRSPLLTFWTSRVMTELASALPYNASNYAYLLNTTSKTFALVAASLALLDAATTASVSAASFAAYLEGEVTLSFPSYWITIIILAGFVVICLSGLKESVGLAFSMLCIHVSAAPGSGQEQCIDVLLEQVASMIVLVLASAVHWARSGNQVLRENWYGDPARTPSSVAYSIFFGACLGLLGLTGFECLPMNIELLKPGAYPRVLRNMHVGATLLNAPLMLLVFANLSTADILSGANVLSLLGEAVASRWLRILIVVDASIVLCGGILTGFLSVASVLKRLSR